MAMKNEVNAPVLLASIIVSALLLLVTVIAVDAWYKDQEQQEVSAKWDESPNTWLADLRAQQDANLRDGHMINRSHYRLSIDDAIAVFIQKETKQAAK